jgi:hypothetical protein
MYRIIDTAVETKTKFQKKGSFMSILKSQSELCHDARKGLNALASWYTGCDLEGKLEQILAYVSTLDGGALRNLCCSYYVKLENKEVEHSYQILLELALEQLRQKGCKKEYEAGGMAPVRDKLNEIARPLTEYLYRQASIEKERRGKNEQE